MRSNPWLTAAIILPVATGALALLATFIGLSSEDAHDAAFGIVGWLLSALPVLVGALLIVGALDWSARGVAGGE